MQYRNFFYNSYYNFLFLSQCHLSHKYKMYVEQLRKFSGLQYLKSYKVSTK